jgi:hypothetical protein
MLIYDGFHVFSAYRNAGTWCAIVQIRCVVNGMTVGAEFEKLSIEH